MKYFNTKWEQLWAVGEFRPVTDPPEMTNITHTLSYSRFRTGWMFKRKNSSFRHHVSKHSQRYLTMICQPMSSWSWLDCPEDTRLLFVLPSKQRSNGYFSILYGIFFFTLFIICLHWRLEGIKNTRSSVRACFWRIHCVPLDLYCHGLIMLLRFCCCPNAFHKSIIKIWSWYLIFVPIV